MSVHWAVSLVLAFASFVCPRVFGICEAALLRDCAGTVYVEQSLEATRYSEAYRSRLAKGLLDLEASTLVRTDVGTLGPLNWCVTVKV